ncbi:Integrator complex subunit 12 [Cichlidogyrus casuarinus]|uniref:Integrator complex subunit 12 n=1 Tax=Cichlidogyrus casuarinus TaxID=1844966 RepID=A0ABD2QKT7_9PLAT
MNIPQQISPYGQYCSQPISEAWLIKALRLFHSNKPESTSKLKRMYKEACENETNVTKISLAEALKDLSDEQTQPIQSNTKSRIAAPSFGSLTSQPSNQVSSKLSTPVERPNIVINQSAQSVSLDASANKKAKVTFFNMFDSNKNLPIKKAGGASGVMDLVASLNCSICGRMSAQMDGKNVSSSNLLVECTSCGALYHQLCHKPQLLSPVTPADKWKCNKCDSNLST